MYHQFMNRVASSAKPPANVATTAVCGRRPRSVESASTQATGKITATKRGMDRSGRGGNGYESGMSRLPSAYTRYGSGHRLLGASVLRNKHQRKGRNSQTHHHSQGITPSLGSRIRLGGTRCGFSGKNLQNHIFASERNQHFGYKDNHGLGIKKSPA